MPRSQTEIRFPEDHRDIVSYITERLRERDGDQLAKNLFRFLRDGDSDSGDEGDGGALADRMTDLENRMSAQMAELAGQVSELRQLLDTPPQIPSEKPPTYPTYEEFEPGTSRVIPLEILIQADDLNRKGMTYSGIVKKLRLPWSSTTLSSAVRRRRERHRMS